MKYLYIENYLLISKDSKLEFINYIHSFKRFKIENQKVILNDNSLVVKLSNNSSLNIAKKAIDCFFKDKNEIQIYTIDEMALKNKKVEIYKDNKLVKRVDAS
ncbi:hypothetical protein CRV08_00010 [Halarcobacter ebronensis]|uniref:Uncharacterized protein n=1 Tax=Halarcobacter ebronensis TaxID=1462615 RepID=A0A4Q0YI57_9BACT|nr:hypothetical protein [Halarcobacter ebronensis]QKF82309.1 hypothetical protein AEBR_1828 [Halarcobacter ebronensis]RXJ69983.1 hypothetical protein CRV08_00010 [Halarcobacter ebronensis]RXK07660.1 hypothetical protein CRV07_04145 [Halarcobacter ebronensis]